MRIPLLVFVVCSLSGVLFAQVVTSNPLDEMKAKVEQVLEQAGVPFSEQQHRALALVMEEQRQASERLFGDIMDFSNGPVRGADRDRALAGIQWMNEAFEAKLIEVMTAEQNRVWAEVRAAELLSQQVDLTVAPASSQQVAQIRINNNAYTTENFGGGGGPGFGRGGGGRDGGGGGGIQVIQRGGAGDYHGNFSFDFRDEALTARNAFADNKPPFQQRNINANVSGPFIRDVLTANFTFNQNEHENADTVVATTPTGPVSFGIVRPEVSRSYSTNGQLQVSEAHSLHFNARYQNRDGDNNGVGRFTLPERAWSQTSGDVNMSVRDIWSISPRMIHEIALSHFGNHNANESATRAVTIDVLDAFNAGGADRNSQRTNRNYTLTNLFWYEGDRITFKTGTELSYRTASSFSEDGFLGTFTFSSLDDYLAGRPLTYTLTQGNPLLAGDQKEWGAFVQTDWRISRRFTLFGGLRYEQQTNIDDIDNVDPRFGFAYSLGTSTVVRGGAGLFHQNLNLGLIQDVRRLDGKRQFDIVVSNPTYPDPFVGGDKRIVPPSSRRVFAPDLAIPHTARASLSVERTLPWNVSVDGSYEFDRGNNRFRTRNLNAPRPGQTVRPDPSEGNILQLESTARSRSHSLRVGIRQRLRFLTYTANYTLSSDYDDGEGPFSQPMNNWDPAADWGRAGFNQKHRYSFNVNAQAPFGTLFRVNAFGNSGQPYNITTGKDDNGDQRTNDRPAGVPRNSADGPRFFNVNMTLSKTFRLRQTDDGRPGGGGGAQLSVYANLNNAFNIVNRRSPSGVITSSYFGIPTSAAQARDVEIGMRYQF